MNDYSYTAFISYRHTSPDDAVARRLHTLIENYAIPADVKKSSGRKKMGRVFRDSEELPLSTDLGGDIRRALDGSEWLIAICSPRYLESKWCMTELDYFISLGRRDHILAILTEGEPEESFPEQLRTIIEDGKAVEIEPLAGDVRAATLSGSLKKLSQEKLRLLSPMLGVRYDDLRQRARRRKRRLAALCTAGAFALLAGFLTFALIKNAQISRQNEQILQQNEEISAQNDQISEQNKEISKQRDRAVNNEMQALIEQANVLVAGSDKLPAKKMLAEAAKLRGTVGTANDGLLSDALEAALYTGSFETVQMVDMDNRKLSGVVFSHNDKYLLGITGINTATLIDAENGGVLHSVSRTDVAVLDSVGFTEDDRYFYTVDSWYNYVCVYDVKTGELYRQFDRSNGIAWNIGEKVFALKGNRLLIPLRNTMALWDLETGEETEILPLPDGMNSYIQPFMTDVSPDERFVVVGSPGYGSGLKILALDGSSELQLEIIPPRGYSPIMFSGNGRFVAASSGNMYFVWDAESGKTVLQGAYTGSYMLDEARINYDGSTLLLTASGKLAAVDVKTGNMLWEKTADSSLVTLTDISPNGLYVCASGGIEGVFDIRNGEVLTTLSCAAFSNDGTRVLCDSYGSDPALLITPEASTAKLADSYDGEIVTTARYTEPAQSIWLGQLRYQEADTDPNSIANANKKSAVYISPDTKYLAYTHFDGFVELFDISDPDNAKESYCLSDHCYFTVTDLVFHGDLVATTGGFDPRCCIFDISTGKMLHVLRGSRYAWQCEFSPDGTKLIMLCGLPKSIVYVYSVESGAMLYHYTAPDGLTFTTVGFSADSKTSVALLEDGRALIGTLYGSLEEMIEKAEE